MPKYKVGDVAALFSKPKSPTTTGGKKLQSLFEDYYSKKGNSTFHPQETASKLNENANIKKMNEESYTHTLPQATGITKIIKKKKKRKLSLNDTELTENISSKKFKKSFEQNDSVSNVHKKQKLKDFPKKKYSKVNDNGFSKKINKKFYEENEALNETGKKFKVQQDFPRKNKQSKTNTLTSSQMFPKFEAEHDSENDSESPSVPKLKNVQKESNQSKSFIKKSKKKQSKDQNNYKFSNDISGKNSDDSDDASLKKEVEDFMHDNFKGEETFNLKGQDTTRKQKKKFLTNKSSQEHEESSDQIVKLKKKHKKSNYEGFESNSPSKTHNSLGQDKVKNSKKPKHKLIDSDVNCKTTYENKSEINISKDKVIDFIRKPKSKIGCNTLVKDNFNKANSITVNDVNTSEDKEFNNNIKKGHVKKFEVEAPDFIKLPSLNEDDEKSYEERLRRTLFVGNLPKNISKQEVKNLFTSFGAVKAIRLPGIETDKAKIFGKNPPKLLHSNYAAETVPGFVVFKERQSAVDALKLSGFVFKGHHITVDFAVPAGTHKLYDGKRSIFIGNLPFNVKDESIWNAFNHCGRIEGVRVVRDRQTGLGKGFGYVLFSTVEAKQTALALENLNIEGREIRIKTVDSNKNSQKANSSPSTKRDTFKSRALRMKKNMKVDHGHKTIRKLTNKQKMLHKKRKTAEILQKVMK